LRHPDFKAANIPGKIICTGYISMGKYAGHEQISKENRMNIYVGNLSNNVTDEDLRQEFEEFGQVESATVIKDKFSGESRGFGFVEMPSKEEASAAIAGLQERDLKGRKINVNEARPRPTGGRGGGKRGDSRRGGRGGGGGAGRRGGRGNGYGGGGGRERY
jgi:RNA recognition motif-containing protein